MNAFVTTQAGLAVDFLVGSTFLLGFGALAVSLTNRLAIKQRAAEITVLITAIWVLLSVIPLPRIARPMPTAWATANETEDATGLLTSETATNGTEPTADAPRIMLQPNQPLIDRDEPQAQTAIALTWRQVAWRAYALVGGCLLAWIVGAHLAMTVVCLRSRDAPPWIHEVYDSIKKRTRSRLVISKRNIRPMSFGVVRPIIMLPNSLDDESKSRTLRHVLLHEQVHIERRDAVGNTILLLSLPLLWCHPLYWYLRFTIDFSRELIADDAAANQTDKLTYITDLTDLLCRSRANASAATGAIGVIGFRHPFTRRMSSLLERTEPLPVRIGLRKSLLMHAAAACVLAIATAGFGVRAGVGQEVHGESDEQVNQQTPPPKQPDLIVNAGEKPAKHVEFKEHLEFKNAIVHYANDLSVTAPEDGRIVMLNVDPGQTVEKGDLSVTISNSELEQDLIEASQNIRILEQNIATDVNVRDAKMSLKLALAEQQNQRNLARENASPRSELLRSEQMAERAKLRVELAEAESKKLELELERDQAVLNQLKDRISQLQVRAPTHGTIESVDVNQGNSVRRGDRLFRLVALDKIRVEFDVPVSKVFPPQLLHQEVSFVVRSSTERSIKLRGKVSFVSSEVDLNNQSRAWAICDNVRRDEHWAVRAGMTGEVTIGAPLAEKRGSPNTKSPNAKADDGILLDKLARQESEYLEELIVSQTSIAEVAKRKLENGTGSRQEYASARVDLWQSKAALAIAKNKHDEVASAYEKAIQFAESAEQDFEQEVKEGRGNMLELSHASRRKTEIKLDYLRYQRTRARGR